MLQALVSLTLLCLPNLGFAVELGFRSLESYPGTKIPNYDGGERPFAEILMFVSCHTQRRLMPNLNHCIVGAICNDGSVASYYVEQGDYTAGQTIMVYLEVSFQVMMGSERAK